MSPASDPDHEGNGPAHRTGRLCVEGCGRPAGTRWSRWWCQPCNAERMLRISASLESLAASLGAKP
jgi:hypothetical protein